MVVLSVGSEYNLLRPDSLAEMQVNPCYKCAFKHLSQARKVYSEICQGYAGDVIHISDLIGDLACAAAHLLEKQPDLSDAVRKGRVDLLDFFALNPGKVPLKRPDLDIYLKIVYEFMVEEERLKNEERKGNGESSEALQSTPVGN